MIAKNKKTEKRGRHWFWLVFMGFFLAALIGFLFFSNLSLKQKRTEMAQQIVVLEKELKDLSEKNQYLKEGLFQSSSDQYWEARLYEQGYKKPGEEAIVIVPLTEKEEKGESATEKKGWWASLRELFGF